MSTTPLESTAELDEPQVDATTEREDVTEVPDDVRALLQPVLAHRLLPSAEAATSGRDVAAILQSIAAQVPVPAPSA